MKNSKAIFQDFIRQVTLPESKDEIASIAHRVLEHIAGISRNDILLDRPVNFTSAQEIQLAESIDRINLHEPVQYVLGEQDFFGRTFHVNKSVLIPRPETEYLIREIIAYCKNQIDPLTIIDIGTGSGCIPVTLSLEIPQALVYATDISTDALAVARGNAAQLNATVNFLQHDILTQKLPVTAIDIIVSNPPYIALEEATQMSANVTQYEPHLALFVPNNDPLKFYRAIAIAARGVLNPGGLLIVEINERFGNEVATILEANRFHNIAILKDLDGKDRVVKGNLLAD